jgi:uncharacterized protein YggE
MSQQIPIRVLSKESREKAPVIIISQGNSNITRRAERAIVAATVSIEGHDQETVSKGVTVASTSLQNLFAELGSNSHSGEPAPNAPVTAWNMRSVSTSSDRPRDPQGVELARRYTANAIFEVEFRDFTKMGPVTTQLLAMPNVNINSTVWRLTEQTKESLGSQSRKEAVQDAMARARDFAEAAGCKEVRPFEIADGYSSLEYASDVPQGRKSAEGSELSFVPEDVQLRANVTIKCYAE